jgi:hypothetical protein
VPSTPGGFTVNVVGYLGNPLGINGGGGGTYGMLLDGGEGGGGGDSGQGGVSGYGASLAEQMMCIGYPGVCSQVATARNNALQERQRRYGNPGDNDDWCDNAFLHAYWNALMVHLVSSRLLSDTHYPGFTAVEITKGFADAHEDRPNNPPFEKQMDFWNNNVGRIIATQNPNATPEQLADLIQNEVNAGRVLVMDSNESPPRHPRPGECDPDD